MTNESGDPGSGTGARAIVAALGMFALGFAAMAAAIHVTIRDPLHLHADIRSEKLMVLDQMKGRAASAAFGSSHIDNGFNPGAFDRELSGTELQTVSENLGVSGGSQSEQRAMAIEFASHLKPPSPAGDGAHACIVLLELNAGANFQNDDLVHPRAINIYDWKTALYVSHLVAPEMNPRQRLGRMGYALAAAGLHYMSVGMLSNMIFAPPVDKERLSYETVDDRRGQKIELYNPPAMPSIRKEIAAAPKQTTVLPAVMFAGNAEAVQQIALASAVPNLSFAYIVMPKLEDMKLSYDYPDHIVASGREVPIIDLARPDRFPQLYNAELWHDDAHLNQRGAEVGSALLANELKKWHAAHGGVPRCGG